MYVLSAQLHVEGLGAQPATVTGSAGGAAAETVLHEAVLYLVALGMHPVEEFLYADYAVVVAGLAVPVPDDVFLAFAEVAPGHEGPYSVLRRHVHQMVLEPGHLVAAPAGYGPVVNALALVGHHQVFAQADYLAQTAAFRAGAEGRVVVEQVFIGPVEEHAVALETGAEALYAAAAHYRHIPAAAVEGVGNAAQQTGAEVGIRADGVGIVQLQAVYQQHRPFGVRLALQHILDVQGAAVCEQTRIALSLEGQQQLDAVGAVVPANRRKDVEDSLAAALHV